MSLDPSGNADTSAWNVFHGVYVPHAYAGSDAVVAPLPDGRVVAVTSTDSSVEAFVLAP